ncbi:class I SAM-dependent methyltransferase [Bosea sp. BK604]|uniref:methyltransferase domain-containing protein n=1 Tax=Bosea sp. BK604 TaxID=2512180 RepID=UPI0010E3FD9E|nr:class I SAM-dependent methyltransferase [Bosea sp. BK604]TCR64309.1 methyltransferase family protein [Bosea sp. BK604]
MNDVASNPYDAVAYPGHAFSQTFPDKLGTIAHFHGMDPAPLARMRVLELGCGSGGNLIPMAFQYPGAQFVGIDLSLSAIALARRNAGELSLANIVFEHRDIMNVAAELGRFDYIIVHGVYSWVPSQVRDKILAIFGELLAPQGVAYVSYNAQPGGHLRDIARDVMLFQTRDVSDPQERVRVARASLKRFAEASDPDSFYGAALRLRLQQIDELPDAVLYHDDLNPDARAFTLREILADAARHGLKFLAEASFPNQLGAARGPAQQLLATITAEDPLEREQSLDLLIGRPFRETLLCRDNIVVRRGITAASLAPYHLAADVRPVEVAEEERRPGVDRFQFGAGARLSIDLASCKAALRALGAAWPGSIPHAELVADALRESGAAGEREAARLNDALVAIFRAGLLDIHREAPRVANVISERPVASAVARWQAETSAYVTDLRHRSVELDSLIVRKFVCLMDGTRDTATLLEDLNRFLAEAKASGRAPPGLPERVTEQEVLMHSQDVARLALLSG